ncbi:MAG TPA: hypothetical protein VKY59_14980 [Spirillospora sp.]|nr:hypothetical protein [Spirillospora sp.]
MLSLERIVIDGILISLAIGVLIMGSLIYNPRLWLNDYPEAIRRQVPPLTPAEKRAQRIVLIPFLLLMLVGPYLSVAGLRADSGGSLPFVTAYLHVFLLLNIFNLFDAVIIDLAVLTLLKPRFMILPGTAAADYAALHDWGLHLRNYLKGIIFCAVLALPVALVAVL